MQKKKLRQMRQNTERSAVGTYRFLTTMKLNR